MWSLRRWCRVMGGSFGPPYEYASSIWRRATPSHVADGPSSSASIHDRSTRILRPTVMTRKSLPRPYQSSVWM